jgi:hypothetical protein
MVCQHTSTTSGYEETENQLMRWWTVSCKTTQKRTRIGPDCTQRSSTGEAPKLARLAFFMGIVSRLAPLDVYRSNP